MAVGRQIIGDLTRALMVLALLFLSFSHAPRPDAGQVGASPAVHAALLAAAALSDLCGGADDDANLGHAPCHACRIDAALLPPAPCSVMPAFANAETLAYFSTPETIALSSTWQPAASRAPPIA